MPNYSSREYERLSGELGGVLDKQPSFHGMFYGPSGSGKTVVACAVMETILPKGKGALHIDIGQNWTSMKNHPDWGRRIQSQPFTSLADISLIAEMIFDKYGKYKNFGGIILDEASSMSGIETDVVQVQRDPNALKPEWEDYNVTLASMRKALASLFAIPDFHVILTAHETSRKVEKRVIFEATPAFSPKIAEKVKEPMHLVARLTSSTKKTFTADGAEAVEYERKAQVHPLLKFDAKTRMGFKRPFVSTDSLPRAVNMWLESGAKEKENPEPKEAPEEMVPPAPVEESSFEASQEVDSDEDLDSFAV